MTAATPTVHVDHLAADRFEAEESLRQNAGVLERDGCLVGEGQQDHVYVRTRWKCTKPITLYKDIQPHRKLLTGMVWLATRGGMGATK